MFLPMAIIGPLKASCGTSQAITTTAAWAALSRSAGASAATDRIARVSWFILNPHLLHQIMEAFFILGFTDRPALQEHIKSLFLL